MRKFDALARRGKMAHIVVPLCRQTMIPQGIPEGAKITQ